MVNIFPIGSITMHLKLLYNIKPGVSIFHELHIPNTLTPLEYFLNEIDIFYMCKVNCYLLMLSRSFPNFTDFFVFFPFSLLSICSRFLTC